MNLSQASVSVLICDMYEDIFENVSGFEQTSAESSKTMADLHRRRAGPQLLLLALYL